MIVEVIFRDKENEELKIKVNGDDFKSILDDLSSKGWSIEQIISMRKI